jgi:hypothetical protein
MNTTFWKLDLFLYSGEGWETPTLLGLLERANLNHCIPVTFLHKCFLSYLRLAVHKGPINYPLCSILDYEKVHIPII